MVLLPGCLVLAYSSKCFSSAIFLLPTGQCDVLEMRKRENTCIKVLVMDWYLGRSHTEKVCFQQFLVWWFMMNQTEIMTWTLRVTPGKISYTVPSCVVIFCP